MATKKRRKSKNKPGPITTPFSHTPGLGFIDPLEVSALSIPPVLTPQQEKLSKMVTEEISNLMISMSSADGPGTDLLIGIAHDAGIDPMDDLRMGKLVKDLSSLKLNSYLVVGHRAYFKTPDNKIEEAASYVFRLEQSVIAIHKKLSLGKN